VRSDAPKGRSPRFSVVVSVMVMELRRRPAKEKVGETCDGAGLVLCARLRVPPGLAEVKMRGVRCLAVEGSVWALSWSSMPCSEWSGHW
jgi:hypothetical protein